MSEGSERHTRRTELEPPAGSSRTPAVVGMSRFTIVLAIAGVGLSSAVMLIYSLITLLRAIWDAFAESAFDIDGMTHLALELIEMTDFFLLGMVLYVVAIGMYQLFVDPNIGIPEWMRVHSIDELKTQIINVIVVMLVVTFLGVALSTRSGGLDFFYFGLAIAVVVIAVSLFNLVHLHADGDRR